MKYKTTNRAVSNGYRKIITVGYCELQTLLKYESPIAYASGVYGWNYDVYQYGNVAIVTGYRSFPKGIHADYKTVRKYEAMASGKNREELEQLIKLFIDEVLKGA